MGLTVHYSLQSATKNPAALIESMRQLALDLPFDEVGEVVHRDPDFCQRSYQELRDAKAFDVLSSDCSVVVPWGRKRQMTTRCFPLELFWCNINVGDGCEPLVLSLAQFPAEMEVAYRPEDDDKFSREINDRGWTGWEFDRMKWRRWCEKNGHERWSSPTDFYENRIVKTKLGNRWLGSHFCKTQYASSPECGGLANFLRCHISVVTLLERIAKLPTVKLEYDDEGKYGPSYYSDDYREAYAAKRQPTYVWHEGKYSVQALAKEVGEWNEMVAAFVGGFKDAFGADCKVPICDFANFEQLEFHGTQDPNLAPFLEAMKSVAKVQKETATPAV